MLKEKLLAPKLPLGFRPRDTVDAPVAGVAASRALQVSPRDQQHEHGETYGGAQEAPQVASPGPRRRRRRPRPTVPGAAAAAAVRLAARPALLQLVPDPPQAGREHLSHGAR